MKNLYSMFFAAFAIVVPPCLTFAGPLSTPDKQNPGAARFQVLQGSNSAAVPPGYSSSEIHVKYRQGAPVELPELLLPADLRNSVATTARLFSGIPRQRLDKMKESGESHGRKKLPDLNLWFKITLKPGTDASAFIQKLKLLDNVESAEFAPLPARPPATTPDFTGNQGYLEAAPDGIDALYSFTIPGGNGTGVKIYDVEYKSWNQDHEDLTKAQGVAQLVDGGDSGVDPFGDDHGTAVLGVLIANSDIKGVTGISWGANIGLAPAQTTLLGYNPAHAIALAAADGSPGDVILVEQQIAVCGFGNPNFGPPEWSSPVFDAIQTAAANGLIVVETAGNGAVNLDQPACGGLFDRSVRDSGAIIVGAGRSPVSGFDRQRKFDSSYGSRVDLQGWGEGVMTTGIGSFYTDPDDPTDRNFFYANSFAGTSSAAPMIAGAAANLQGITLSRFGVPLTPSQIRALLVETGSHQLGNISEHVGPRPDLFRAISQLLGVTAVLVDIRPGNFPNSINPKSKGVVPVAILSTNTFDATTVDPSTVRFGRNGTEAVPVQFALADIDNDGNTDLILHFRTQDTGVQCGDVFASLVGQTFTGPAIGGFDSVRPVACKVS